MKIVIFYLSILFLQFGEAKTVRILNWWDYFDQRIINKLEDKGIKVEIIEYRSNEVALSKIGSKPHDFDIAIISNAIYDTINQAELLDNESLKHLKRTRQDNYLKYFNKLSDCVPFMWSSTVFSYDSRYIKIPPTKLNELVSLRNTKIKIGIIDDQFEVATRTILDSKNSCESEKPLNDCVNLLHREIQFEKKDFFSSLEEVISRGNFVVYGWHGEAAGALKKHSWIEFEVANTKPVIGVDYVCILKKAKNKKNLVDVVDLITDRESIRWNMEKTQYFSPYNNDKQGLELKVDKLYEKIVKKIDSNGFIMVTIPNGKQLQDLNIWWRNARFKK